MDGGFGNDIGIESVAEVDRVDIVTAVAWISDLCTKVILSEHTIPDRCT